MTALNLVLPLAFFQSASQEATRNGFPSFEGVSQRCLALVNWFAFTLRTNSSQITSTSFSSWPPQLVKSLWKLDDLTHRFSTLQLLSKTFRGLQVNFPDYDHVLFCHCSFHTFLFSTRTLFFSFRISAFFVHWSHHRCLASFHWPHWRENSCSKNIIFYVICQKVCFLTRLSTLRKKTFHTVLRKQHV